MIKPCEVLPIIVTQTKLIHARLKLFLFLYDLAMDGDDASYICNQGCLFRIDKNRMWFVVREASLFLCLLTAIISRIIMCNYLTSSSIQGAIIVYNLTCYALQLMQANNILFQSYFSYRKQVESYPRGNITRWKSRKEISRMSRSQLGCKGAKARCQMPPKGG